MRLDPSRDAIERWGHLQVGRVAPRVSPAYYPTVSPEGSMNHPALRGKDARLHASMYGGTSVAYLHELDILDDEDDFGAHLPVRRPTPAYGAQWESFGTDEVFAAVDEAKAAAAEAKRAARAARKKEAPAPFRAVSNLFKRKQDGAPSKAEKVLSLFAKRPEPPQVQIVEKLVQVEVQRTTGTEIAMMAGIGFGMLAVGVGVGMAIERRR